MDTPPTVLTTEHTESDPSARQNWREGAANEAGAAQAPPAHTALSATVAAVLGYDDHRGGCWKGTGLAEVGI